MKVTGLERIHAISEWVFYRSVAEHNLGLTDHKIKASEARILRARLEKKLLENGKSMFAKDKTGVAKLDDLASAINAVYMEAGLETPFPEGKTDALPYFQEFNAICGFDSTNRSVIDDNHGLLLSPYDPTYRASSAMMDTNAGVVVKGSEIDSPSAIMTPNTSCMVHPVDVSGGEVVVSSEETILRTPDDMMGLSRLRWYMSEREYADIRDWVMQGFSEGQYISDDAIRRSVAIMRELNRMGRHYTILRDIKAGQAKLHVEGTNLDVRIIDTPQNAKYMGMAMRDGAYTYRVSSTRRNKEGQTVIPDVSPKVACDLLHFALGDGAEEHDGISHPHGGNQNINRPFQLGVFFALGVAQRQGNRRQHNHQLPAPKGECRQPAAEQARVTSALHHIIRCGEQAAAAIAAKLGIACIIDIQPGDAVTTPIDYRRQQSAAQQKQAETGFHSHPQVQAAQAVFGDSLRVDNIQPTNPSQT